MADSHSKVEAPGRKYYAKPELQVALPSCHAQNLNYSLQSPDLRHCCIVTLSNYPWDKSVRPCLLAGFYRKYTQ